MTIYIIGAFLLSLISGFIFIPLILDFCQRKGIYDIPNERKVHKNAIPRLGGIIFMPNMLLAFSIVILMMNPHIGHRTIQPNLWSFYFLISLMVIYFTGFLDDLIGLNARVKFCAQIISATLIPMAGLCINTLYGFCGIHDISYWPSALLTVFVMVFIMNAINMIDGIDGLCASLSFLALGGFLICFWREGLDLYCTLIAGMMGVLVPFFYHNVFGRAEQNRKIFMGDSGSLTLGFVLSFLFVKFASYNPHVMPFHIDGLIIPFTLLIVPVFDTVRIIIVRIHHHLPLFKADKNHIHHKLMRAGLTQRQTLVIIVGISLSYIILNYLLFQFIDITYILLLDIIIYVLLHYIIDLRIRHREEVVVVL